MSRSSIRLCVLIGVGVSVFAFGSKMALGQNDGYLTNTNARGLAAQNSFQIGDIDNINLATGALNLDIPVFQRKGRGGKLDKQYFFSYSSKIWELNPVPDPLDPSQDSYLFWSFSSEIGGSYSQIFLEGTGRNAPLDFGRGSGSLNFNEDVFDCQDSNGVQYEETADYEFEYQMPDGSAYRLPNLHHYISPVRSGFWCTGLTPSDTGYGEMAEIELDTTTTGAYITELKDGTRNVSDTIYDTNGNDIDSFGKDTLGRTVSYTSQNGTQTWSFTDSNGVMQQVTQQFSGGASATTQFPSAACGTAALHQFTGTMGGATTITMPDGRTYTLTFDPTFGEVTRVTLPTGGYIRYTYVTLAAFDRPVQFALNADCGMDSRRVSARFVSPDGNSQHEQEWQYVYSNTNNVFTTTVTDPLGNVTVHTFDTLRRMHETTTQYYDNAGHLLRTIANTWTNSSRIVSRFPGSTRTSTVTKTQNDFTDWELTQSTTTLADKNQVKEVQTNYDIFSPCGTACTLGNVESQLEYDWGNGSPGPLLRRTVYTYLHETNSNYLNQHILDRAASKNIYDSTSNTCQGQSRACAETNYGYDTTTIAPQSGVIQHDYTDYPPTMILRGNLTTVSNWRNTDNTFLTTTNYYDELGNLIKMTDPRGNTNQFSYADSWSGTACIPSGGAANAFVTKTTNALNQFTTAQYFPCSSLVASATDVNGQSTSSTYDGNDRVTQQTFPDGGLTTNCYSDDAGSSCSSPAVPPFLVTTIKMSSTQNFINTVQVDGLGRPIQTQINSAPQTIFRDTTYDALGRVSTVSNPYYTTSDPTYGIKTTSYDPLGRISQVTDQDGSIVSTTYSGNCTTVTDEQGRQRKSCADGLGRMTSVIEDPTGLGYTTNYTYDVVDNLTSVTQSSSRQRTFTYNSLSQLTQAVNPESGTMSYVYDADGNVISKTAPAPNQTGSSTVTTCFGNWNGSSCDGLGYDALNRLTKKQFSDSTPTVYVDYDGLTQTGCTAAISDSFPKGRQTGMCDAAGNEAWSHDSMGRTLTDQRMTNGVTKTITYTYAPFVDGSIDKITYPSGLAITYSYDGAERPTSAIDANNNSYVLNATYAPQGALQTGTLSATSLFAGFGVTNSYTPRLQPNEMKATAPSGTKLEDFVYCFSALVDNPSGCPSSTGDNGNVMRITNNVTTSRSQMFSYDSLNRLATAGTVNLSGTNCWDESYGYDPWGNLLNIGSVSGYSGCTQPDSLSVGVSGQNQINNPVGMYGYDAAGNLTAAPGSATYAYNAEGQMTSTAGVTYTYDGSGKRVEKSSSKLYWYGMMSDALEDTNTTGTLTDDYIFFGGQRIARRDASGNIFTYLADHLGSSRKMMKIASGANSSTTAYDADFYPFGRENAFVSGTPIYKFTGKERDTESGLDNFGARYDSSTIGRFISPDAFYKDSHLRDPQSWNEYSYVRNNPLRYADPNGEKATVTTTCTTTKKGETTCDVTISASIAIYVVPGSGLTQAQENAAASQIQKSIQSAWSGSFTKDGVKYNVSTQVSVQVESSQDAAMKSGAQNVIGLSNGEAAPGADSFVNARSSFSGPDTGTWNVNSLGSDVAAHEFTHLLGVGDRTAGAVLSNTDILNDPSVPHSATAADFGWGIREAVDSVELYRLAINGCSPYCGLLPAQIHFSTTDTVRAAWIWWK